MNTVLDDWLGELLEQADHPAATNPASAIAVDKVDQTEVSPQPATAISSTPISQAVPVSGPTHSVENVISPSPWAKLQAQAQQTAARVTSAESATRWLRLRCGAQTYAVELLKVQEVVLPLPLLALRGSEPALLGIMNLRGQVVPVIDLNLYLGGESRPTDSHTRIVVLEENGQALGLRTDAVDDVAHLSASDIEIPQHIGLCRNAHTLFCGMARIDDQPTILLDAQQLLHAEA